MPPTAVSTAPRTSLPTLRLVAGSLRGALTSATTVAVTLAPSDAGPRLGDGADEVGAALGLDLAAFVARDDAKGEPGQLFSVPVVGHDPVQQVLVVGIGAGDAPALRAAGAALGRRARDTARLAVPLGRDVRGPQLRAFAESLLLATYGFSMRSEPKPLPLTAVDLYAARTDRLSDDLERATVTAGAVALARDLINTPSLEKTPAWLAKRAADVGRRSGVDVRVRDEAELAAEGFGGILAVGMGSTRPPRLIELRYDPPGARRHVVLVGKGITFDSGGLSIKPTDGMVSMKTDMGGGGAVIAVLGALAALGVRVRVTGLVAAAENMPSGSAQRPGDVIRHYGGRTVEVLNTDAEGRLVMADALAYADTHLDPDVVIDVATLTGAASLGLGRRHGALFTGDDALADALLAAADAGGERLWRMPLVDEYRPALDSPVADLRNVGDPELKFSGGAITAALFLREFAAGRRWAHLDIAGPARSDKEEGDATKGGTGFAVRTLLRYLEGLSGRR